MGPGAGRAAGAVGGRTAWASLCTPCGCALRAYRTWIDHLADRVDVAAAVHPVTGGPRECPPAHRPPASHAIYPFNLIFHQMLKRMAIEPGKRLTG